VLLLVPALALAAGCGRVPEGFGASPSPSDSLGPVDPISPSASAGSPTPSSIDPAPEDSEAPGATDCEYVPTGTPAKPVEPPPTSAVPNSGEVTATFQMTGGTVKVVMDRNAAPCTVNSFVSLVRQKFYDKTRCHRLVDSGIFILQCGDPTGTGTGGPGYSYADELDGTETYPGGVVAMANGGPNTNGSQFFFVYDDSQLDPNYTVFGKMDDASRRVIGTMAYEGQDGKNPAGGGRPNNPSEIVSVTVAAG
jgi:peptidyl-prolyl cis-trans isomerase B (cyclophilin B)